MLKRELELFLPDVLLIELPADVQPLIDVFNEEKLKPPVAILQYDPGNFEKAFFLPFAEFSPEWIALSYAKNAEIPVQAIDLPGNLTMALPKEVFEGKNQAKSDPMAYFAEKSGYADTESWWESFFELEERNGEHFGTIEMIMDELRDSFKDSVSEETLLREAHIRIHIAETTKNADKIAVVCGAWHIPAIRLDERYSEKKDKALLKSLKKVSLHHCWIPWSYSRLKREGGYGAGVEHPAWYEWIYHERVSASAKWIVRVAEFLRKRNFVIPVSSVIDAHQLSNTLAAMRGLSLPGLKELMESMEAGFALDQINLREVLKMNFLTGTKTGFVDEELNIIPIQKNFAARLKTSRLTKDYETGYEGVKALDLRKPANLAASNLLHTLVLLGIEWGEWLEGEAVGLGNFRENWELEWQPEYSLELVKAGMEGNTVDEATVMRVKNRLDRNDFNISGREIDHILKCGIAGIFSMVLDMLARKIASDEDIENWYRIFPKLIQFLKNGNIRKIEMEQLEEMLEKLYVKICLHLGEDVSGTDDEGAKERMHVLNRCDRAIKLWQTEAGAFSWTTALLNNMDKPRCLAMLRGALVRMVMQRGELDLDLLLALAHRELTDRMDIDNAVNWLEGFLGGNPSGILIQKELFEIVDGWVKDLREEEFRLVLPVLRKIFAAMLPVDKRQVLDFSKNENEEKTNENIFFDQELSELVEGNLRRIMGE